MNVFDTLQSLRPKIDPMPMADRRMIREALFGVGHDDATRTIRSRSESGAVVSTAPPGRARPVRSRPKRRGSLPKIAAGLLVIAAFGALAWSYVNRTDGTVESVEASPTSPSFTPTTPPPPPSTEPPFVRTGVSASTPLVLPASLLSVDTVVVEPGSSNDSTALLDAPDGASLWMAEVDGGESGAFGLEIQPYGSAAAIGIDPSRDENSLTSYRPVVPCGFVLVNEGIAQPYDRPPTLELFAAMSIDNEATLDVNLPAGWSIIDVGPIRPEYATVFRLPAAGADSAGSADDAGDAAPATPGDDLVSLSQVPGGSISQFAGNGQRLAPTTFLDGPAWIDIGPLNPDTVTIFWRDDDTVFEVSSATLDSTELATFVGGLEPATVDDWELRFGTDTPPDTERETSCSPQPNFGSTLDP